MYRTRNSISLRISIRMCTHKSVSIPYPKSKRIPFRNRTDTIYSRLNTFLLRTVTNLGYGYKRDPIRIRINLSGRIMGYSPISHPPMHTFLIGPHVHTLEVECEHECANPGIARFHILQFTTLPRRRENFHARALQIRAELSTHISVCLRVGVCKGLG